MWRFDSRAKLYGVKLARRPSEYIRDNIVVTTSGMCAADPLICTLSALGSDHVMFAADYPFESAQEAAEFIDHAPIADDVRADICFNNAAKLLRLPKA
jgi:2,3-dihydroxybenzoate decarboxylase